MSDTQNQGMVEQAAHVAKQGPGSDAIYMPDVDISANNEQILVVADMPGIDPSSVEVTVENNILTIEGQASIESPAGYELVGQEYGVGKFRRDFKLMGAVDTGEIRARVQQGVLKVTLPKREVNIKRKVEITS